MNYLKNPLLVFALLFAVFNVATDLNAQALQIKAPKKRKPPRARPCNLMSYDADACQLVADAQFEDENGNDVAIYPDPVGGNVLIAAPHGANDYGTKAIVEGINNLDNQRWKSLVFFRFRKDNLYFNVNRPTLKIEDQYKGDGIADHTQEEFTKEAKWVYNCFVDKATDLVPLNLMDFYVEIHGNDNEDRVNFLDIAAHEGISVQAANLIQDVFQDALDAENIPLTVAMENTEEDPHFHGQASREHGFFCVLENADVPFLHIEIPSAYRQANNNRTRMIEALNDALAEIQDDGLLD